MLFLLLDKDDVPVVAEEIPHPSIVFDVVVFGRLKLESFGVIPRYHARKHHLSIVRGGNQGLVEEPVVSRT